MIWLAANTNPAGAAVLAFEWDVSAGLFHLTVIGVAVLILWAGVNWRTVCRAPSGSL